MASSGCRPWPRLWKHNGHLALGCALNAKLPRLASAETGRSRLRREFRRFSEGERTTSRPPTQRVGGPAHSLGRLSPETPARGRKCKNWAAAVLVAAQMRCCAALTFYSALTAKMAPRVGGGGANVWTLKCHMTGWRVAKRKAVPPLRRLPAPSVTSCSYVMTFKPT